MVVCTFPTLAQARQIGTVMVEKQLAACVNLLPGVESIYRWKEEICREGEVLAVFKVAEGLFEEFEAALRAAHPYAVPEVLALPVSAGSEAYLNWVRDSR